MARNITITRVYPIINGFVQTPPNLEANKTVTVPNEESIIRTGAGDVYEIEIEEV